MSYIKQLEEKKQEIVNHIKALRDNCTESLYLPKEKRAKQCIVGVENITVYEIRQVNRLSVSGTVHGDGKYTYGLEQQFEKLSLGTLAKLADLLMQ